MLGRLLVRASRVCVSPGNKRVKSAHYKNKKITDFAGFRVVPFFPIKDGDTRNTIFIQLLRQPIPRYNMLIRVLSGNKMKTLGYKCSIAAQKQG